MIYDDLMSELVSLGVARPKVLTQRRVKILQLRRGGMTDQEIAATCDMTAEEVRAWRRSAIIRDYKAGVPLADMIARHAVSRWLVYQFLNETGTPRRAKRMTDDGVIDLYQQHGKFPGHGGRRYAQLHRAGLPLVTEDVEPPPRDELEDALEHWGELGVAQEYHVTVNHVRRWMAHYGIGDDQ